MVRSRRVGRASRHFIRHFGVLILLSLRWLIIKEFDGPELSRDDSEWAASTEDKAWREFEKEKQSGDETSKTSTAQATRRPANETSETSCHLTALDCAESYDGLSTDSLFCGGLSREGVEHSMVWVQVWITGMATNKR